MNSMSKLFLVLVVSFICGCWPSSLSQDGKSKIQTKDQDTQQPSQSNSVSSVSGNEGGNGGDTLSDTVDNAWFLSRDPNAKIKVCLVQAGDFGIKDRLEQSIAFAFKKWAYYIEEHGVKLSIPSEDYQIISEVEFTGCERYDLKIYLGVTSPEVTEEMRKYNDPIGFAHRQEFNMDKGRSKGFIWIKSLSSLTGSQNDGQNYYIFDAILRHEIGHLYGCGHVSGTIMRKDIKAHLENYLHKTLTYDELYALLVESGPEKLSEDRTP